MKKLITLFILGISLNACEKSDQLSIVGDYFFLLKDEMTISVNTFSHTIKEIKTYRISGRSLFTTDHKQRLAILDPDKNYISLYDIRTSRELKLSIPFEIEPIAILLTDENLFIGGKSGKEMLIQYHIQTKKWHQLEIPNEVLQFGKSIDDLVVNDKYLIVIDNVLIPKYILFYHRNSTARLEFSHFKMLNANGAWESIHQGKITPAYLGIYSTTSSGYVGEYEHITIYAGLDLRRSFAISVKSQWNLHLFKDFLILGDKLFIAHKEKGLGTLEIKNSYFDCVYEYESYCISDDVSEDEVTYKQYENEEIMRLTKIPDDKKIILTIRNQAGKIRQEIVEI